MLYQLPPAGHTISLTTGAQTDLSPAEIFRPYEAEFYHSGTAALATAIMAAIRLKVVDSPEVILPAYGCPDLISAVLYAGARPVLVDLEPQRPWMDLELLASSVSSQTVAIIAASLFGIQERMPAIKTIAERSSVVLIEDSAQAFPTDGMASFWTGDLVVISFGRGKPVSLLGGGAVLCQDDRFRGLLPECRPDSPAPALARVTLRLKARLYNLMSSAYVYWMPAGLPFLHLGETRYHPLTSIRCMDNARLELLAANTEAYRRRSLHVQAALAGLVGELATRSGSVVDLPAVCNLPASHALLRYPLLVEPVIRDRVYNRLRREGLGVSRMYPAALSGIAGLEEYLGVAGISPVAQNFAARVLTRPVHERVRAVDIRRIASCLESIA
ncbi:MAG: DegT/DnrJ/EryC1/StrS family aminotransferase [Gammaproteobacteria bacterium]